MTQAADSSEAVSIAVVGNGWRAASFLRLCRLFPDRLRATAVVTRTSERAARVMPKWGVPGVVGLAAALTAERPDLVVVAVPWSASPAVIREVVAHGVPVLSETPPAPDLAGLQRLWSQVGRSGLVQVAEQYPRYPGHVARAAIVGRGVIGTVSNVQVSSTHGYHAVALLRALLGVGFEDVTVRALRTEFELANPIARDGWTHDLSPRPAWNVLAHLDFGSGRSGLYDFTDNQWHNELRSNRILVRGSLGEIAQDQVVHVRDERTVVESQLVRRRLGVDMNFEGFDLDHITFEGEPVFRNQWQGGRLADDEIAVADLLLAAGRWARGSGPAPYPLAQACQDHMISLAIDEAVSRGRPVATTRQPWATAKVDG